MNTSFALVTWTFIWTIDGMDISRFLRFQKGPSRICKISPVASVLVAQIFQQNFYGYDRVPHWQHVDGWKQMKSWCSLPWWRDHEREALGFSQWALARENCAVKRLRPLVGAPHVLSAAALWWTIIECSKGEVQPTGFAWHCYKTALNARLELKCTCWWNTRSHSRQNWYYHLKVTVRKYETYHLFSTMFVRTRFSLFFPPTFVLSIFSCFVIVQMSTLDRRTKFPLPKSRLKRGKFQMFTSCTWKGSGTPP